MNNLNNMNNIKNMNYKNNMNNINNVNNMNNMNNMIIQTYLNQIHYYRWIRGYSLLTSCTEGGGGSKKDCLKKIND